MFRLSAIVCAIFAAGLAVLAGYSAFHQTAPTEAGLVIENPEREFGELSIGEHSVRISVTNQSDRPAEIVGYLGGCGSGCCLRANNQERRTVAPGEAVELVGVLDVLTPGPFAYEDKLFLSDNGELRSVRLKLSGVGVSAEKPNAPPP